MPTKTDYCHCGHLPSPGLPLVNEHCVVCRCESHPKSYPRGFGCGPRCTICRPELEGKVSITS